MKNRKPQALENARIAACAKANPAAVTKEMRQVQSALLACGLCVARMRLGR